MPKTHQFQSRLPKKSRPASRRSKARVSRPVRSVHFIVPPRVDTEVVFYDYYLFASGGAAAYQVQSFRMNSCRDPQLAIGGGGCSGFLQLSYLYLKYRVHSALIECWGYGTCASPTIFGVISRPSLGTLVGSAVEAQQYLLERKDRCVFKTMIPYGANTGYPEFRVRSRRVISVLEGSVLDTTYDCSFGTEPVPQTYFDVCLVAADGAAVSITANAHIRITYRIMCSQPNQEYVD